jgi:Icc-related predicted phosphoesterase
MKLLCFSDLHRDRDAANRLVQLAKKADAVIGAGDFANRHQGAEDTLEILAEIPVPAVLVPGNGETEIELRDAAKCWASAIVLHGQGCQINGLDFWGVGGGIPVTPFGDWSYDFDEKQAGEMLVGCPPGAILVVHSPPMDTVDHDSNGLIRGSKSIRETVEQKQPSLVVCGHIHSDWGKQVTVGPTRIVNAGPKGVLIDVGASES